MTYSTLLKLDKKDFINLKNIIDTDYIIKKWENFNAV